MCSLFEQVVRYCDRYLNMIPLSFILGFYVTIIGIFNQSKKGEKRMRELLHFFLMFHLSKNVSLFSLFIQMSVE
jgi:hypothetical protein